MTTFPGFPGRWLGGFSLILGPLLVLAGILVRAPYHFFFPEQLEAYADHPAVITTAYGLFAAGTVLLAPAVLVLARLIGEQRPRWASWGAALTLLGLFTRTFHGGIDHLAFQLVRVQGTDAAIGAVAGSYSAWHLFRAPALAVLAGWVLLAAGAYRAKVLKLPRAVALALTSALALGTLKGTQIPQSLIAGGGLCVALVPLGVRILRDGPRPGWRAVVTAVAVSVALTLLALFGPQG